MAVRSLKSIIPVVWIPPIQGPNWKMTITRHDASIDDITDYTTFTEIIDGVTEGIGSFEVEVINIDDRYTDAWTGMEVFTYYCEYGGGTPTTKVFRGRVEKVGHKESKIILSGRSETLYVHSKNVVKYYANKDIGYIVKDLFDSYGESRYDTSSINVSTGVLLTFDFVDLPFWTAIESACSAAGYDCYVDAALVVQLFEAESNINTTDGIVHGNNLVSVSDFGNDSRMAYNQIRVIGATIDGVQVMYTANDAASQASPLGIKRQNYYDEGLTTTAAAKEVGDYLLAQQKIAPQVGEITGLLLASVKPGDMVWCSSPLDNVPPTRYRIVSYKHEFKDEGQFTTLTLNKEPKKLSRVLKDRIQREHVATTASQNPDDLDHSLIDLFNTDTGSHSGTRISIGLLGLDAGYSTGTWTSPTYETADGNVATACRISLVGDNLMGISVEVSADGGVTYQSVVRDTLTTFNNPGKNLKVKITLAGTVAKLDSLQFQYGTS